MPWRPIAIPSIIFLIPWIYAAHTAEGLRDLTDGHYTTVGAFIPNGVYPTTKFQHSGDAKSTCLGSWAGSDSNTGSFQSAAFAAPTKLSVLLAGRPTMPGIRLYLLDGQKGENLPLSVTYDPSEQWRRVTWTLPDPWRGRRVYLVADDQSRDPGGWIGVSLPQAGEENDYLYSLFHAISLQFGLWAEAGLFLLPGVAIAFLLNRRIKLDFARSMSVLLLGSAATAYLFFWAYFVRPLAGKLLLIAVVSGALFILARSVHDRNWNPGVLRETAYCVAMTLLLAGFYMGCSDALRFGGVSEVQAQDRVVPWHLPGDNGLPYIFAEKIYQGEPVRPFLVVGWQSSDRPPLQTGAVLMQFPVWPLAKTLHYGLLATFLQALWAPALWVFLKRAGVGLGTILGVLSFCAFSEFFFVNTIYVWPKLLAAALALVGLAFSPLAGREPQRLPDALLLGSGIALGALSHTGVLLTILGWMALSILRSFRLPWRTLLPATITFAVLWAPWEVYQKVYDPPGDTLMRMHLAGKLDPSRSFLQTLSESYSKLPVHEIVHNKVENLRALLISNPNAYSGSLIQGFLGEGFFSVFQTLALLNIGLAVLLWHRLRRSKTELPEVAAGSRIGLVAGLSILIWCAMMFGPGTTVIHQGSLLNIIFLFAAGAVGLIALAPGASEFVFIVHVFLIFPVVLAGKWIMLVNRPGSVWNHAVDSGSAVAAAIIMVSLCWCAFRLLGADASAGETSQEVPASETVAEP
jgi:hypothetical protein